MLVTLAISFAAFVSVIGYQSFYNTHNHELYSSENIAPASLSDANFQGQTRTYYIAADEVQWNFAPTGMNQITGKPFDGTANVYMESGKDRIGKISLKAVYQDRKSTRLNSSHPSISYAVFCLKKKKNTKA